MRLDKFLQVTGVLKRREAAKEACEAGHVLVDGTVARPAKEVSAGQVIRFESPRRTLKLEILEVPRGNVAKGDRPLFVRILEDYDTGEQDDR